MVNGWLDTLHACDSVPKNYREAEKNPKRSKSVKTQPRIVMHAMAEREITKLKKLKELNEIAREIAVAVIGK